MCAEHNPRLVVTVNATNATIQGGVVQKPGRCNGNADGRACSAFSLANCTSALLFKLISTSCPVLCGTCVTSSTASATMATMAPTTSSIREQASIPVLTNASYPNNSQNNKMGASGGRKVVYALLTIILVMVVGGVVYCQCTLKRNRERKKKAEMEGSYQRGVERDLSKLGFDNSRLASFADMAVSNESNDFVSTQTRATLLAATPLREIAANAGRNEKVAGSVSAVHLGLPESDDSDEYGGSDDGAEGDYPGEHADDVSGSSCGSFDDFPTGPVAPPRSAASRKVVAAPPRSVASLRDHSGEISGPGGDGTGSAESETSARAWINGGMSNIDRLLAFSSSKPSGKSPRKIILSAETEYSASGSNDDGFEIDQSSNISKDVQQVQQGLQNRLNLSGNDEGSILEAASNEYNNALLAVNAAADSDLRKGHDESKKTDYGVRVMYDGVPVPKVAGQKRSGEVRNGTGYEVTHDGPDADDTDDDDLQVSKEKRDGADNKDAYGVHVTYGGPTLLGSPQGSSHDTSPFGKSNNIGYGSPPYAIDFYPALVEDDLIAPIPNSGTPPRLQFLASRIGNSTFL